MNLVSRNSRYSDWEPVSSYHVTVWGLHDMNGNTAEWTRTTYRPCLSDLDDGRDKAVPEGRKVVRGGSSRDRPKPCRSAFRLSLPLAASL